MRHAARLMAALGLAAAIVLCQAAAAPGATSHTYTSDADFDEGTLLGVEHESVPDQLQLAGEATTLPFIWVPNLKGTVSKLDTATGREMGRYRVAPSSLPRGGNPSRTTVDLLGNCWVGNRQAGTVVKIGLFEAGQWTDRNGDGLCQTSRDVDLDGDITGAELLPWGEDECVLHEVVLVPGHEGTYAPGTYPGPYDTEYWGVAPRGLAVDRDNDLWAGTWATSRYYHIDGDTGAILADLDVAPWGHQAYGAVIDDQGILWSSGQATGHVLRVDPTAAPAAVGKLEMGHFVYGLALDYLSHLFTSGWAQNVLSRIDILTATKEWTKPDGDGTRGVVATADNNIWAANSHANSVTRYDNDGNLLATIPVGGEPTGVTVDGAGKVWVCDKADEYIHRIDPAANAIDLSKRVVGSGGHYTYSDMTGIISRTITTKVGTWTVVFDSQDADSQWGTVSWTSFEPAETSVTVRVRTSNDQQTWSPWEEAASGVPLQVTPDGRYVEIQTTLLILTGNVSPVLSSLTVRSAEAAATAIQAGLAVEPQPLNLATTRPANFTCLIDLPEGYNEAEIEQATLRLSLPDCPQCGLDVSPAGAVQGALYAAQFSRALLRKAAPGEVRIKVAGQLTDGTELRGSATIQTWKPLVIIACDTSNAMGQPETQFARNEPIWIRCAYTIDPLAGKHLSTSLTITAFGRKFTTPRQPALPGSRQIGYSLLVPAGQALGEQTVKVKLTLRRRLRVCDTATWELPIEVLRVPKTDWQP